MERTIGAPIVRCERRPPGPYGPLCGSKSSQTQPRSKPRRPSKHLYIIRFVTAVACTGTRTSGHTAPGPVAMHRHDHHELPLAIDRSSPALGRVLASFVVTPRRNGQGFPDCRALLTARRNGKLGYRIPRSIRIRTYSATSRAGPRTCCKTEYHCYTNA